MVGTKKTIRAQVSPALRTAPNEDGRGDGRSAEQIGEVAKRSLLTLDMVGREKWRVKRLRLRLVEGSNLFAVSRSAGRSCNIRVRNIHSSNIPCSLHLGGLGAYLQHVLLSHLFYGLLCPY